MTETGYPLRVGIARFPHTTGTADALRSTRALGWEPVLLPPECEGWDGDLALVLIPGGDPDAAALASQARSPLGAALRDHAAAGGRLLGLGAGFALLCELGLLPGRLESHREGRLVHGPARLRWEPAPPPGAPWTAGQVLSLPLATRAGAFALDPEALVELELEGRVVLRFCGPGGEVGEAWNPTGAQGGVGGVRDATGRILGLIPQLERASEGEAGRTLLRALGPKPSRLAI